MELMSGWRFPEAQQPIADRIQPRDITFFHGKLDVEKLKLPEKLIVRGLKPPPGDFRDWQAITVWAQTIAETLKAESG